MPARLRDIARAIEEHGCSVERPSKGSHWKARSVAGKMYPLPCHNGTKTELDDKYLRGLCAAMGIDFDTFKKSL